MAQGSVVLYKQDTTELDHNGQRMQGLGPLSHEAQRNKYLARRMSSHPNANVLNRGFGATQQRVFEKDWALARRITLAEWQNRPWQEHLQERLATLLYSQL